MVLGQYQLMQEEQQRQTKLKQVIGELSSIKQQLHQLMLPKSGERTLDTNCKTINTPMKQHPITPVTTYNSQHFKRNSIKLSSTYCSINRKSPGHATSILNKGKQSKEKCDQSKINPSNNFQKHSQFRQKLSKGLNHPESELSRNQKLTFQRKRKNQTQNKNKLAQAIPHRDDNQQTVRKQRQFRHMRHNSLQELQPSCSLKSQQLQKSSKHKKIIDLEKIQEKQFFLLRKNVELKPQVKPRTLNRVKSDFDFSTAFTKDTIPQDYNLIKRIRQLESENIAKERAIKILQKQLRQIQLAFNEMKDSIVDLLKKGFNFQRNIHVTNFNQAFSEVIKDFNLQREEIKRLTIEGEGCRKQIYEQSQRIRLYEEQFKHYSAEGDGITFFRDEANRYKEQISKVCSKLQMATHQNRIKDQFIIKYIMGKAVGSKDEELISSLLQNYLKMCQYPSNKLMDKLNQQLAQIKRLRSQLQKDRKNSL